MKNILILLFVATFAGCDSFVEVDAPASQLTGTVVFESRATAEAAMADLLAKLRDNGFLSGTFLGAGAALGLYADELDYYGIGADPLQELYANALLPAGAVSAEVWGRSYHQVYCANAIIEGVAASAALSQADKDLLTGEAQFVRALLHLYLANCFGDIPYVTSTDYEVNRLLPRLSVTEVYSLLVADLTQAATLLPEAYTSPGRIRPNRAAAQAILARAYLYSGNWAEAANMASAVINNTGYVLEPDLSKVFLKESPETIWQFRPRLDGANTDEASLYIFVSGPPPGVALAPGLVGSFGAGDLRRIHWIADVTDGSDTWHHAFKYKDNGFGASTEYSVIIRLAEMYLIRAEARALQGELTAAKDDLNAIRHRAGLTDTPAVTQDEIIQAVQAERRLELFTESGHRFFDLKRTGNANTVLSAKPGWDTTDMLWPLPESEMNANPNLTPQNPGY